jgi:hypothetical protein
MMKAIVLAAVAAIATAQSTAPGSTSSSTTTTVPPYSDQYFQLQDSFKSFQTEMLAR